MKNEQSKLLSVRAAAAAGVAACSVAAATDSAKADIVWTAGPSDINGVHQIVPGSSEWDTDGNNFTFLKIDFDQDGMHEFAFLYYNSFQVLNSRNGWNAPSVGKNPFADVISTSMTQSPSLSTRWDAVTYVGSDLEALYNEGVGFSPVPYDSGVNYVIQNSPTSGFQTRGYMGGVFTGGDGKQYVGYIDLQVTPDSSPTSTLVGDGQIEIFGSGYALIPEPSSLGLLGLGVLGLMGRRRRPV